MHTTWQYTAHALSRMTEMDVTRDEVFETLARPELDYPGSRRYPAGRRVAVRGRLAVVYSETDGCVITVLWHRHDSRVA